MIRVWKAIKWQIQAVFHEIRTAAAFFLVLNAVLLLLPLSACQIIDNMAGFAVVFISVCYAASLLMALFYGMNCMPENRMPARMSSGAWLSPIRGCVSSLG